MSHFLCLPYDVEIHGLFELRSLVARPSVVEHGLGFVASVDNDALDKIRVLEGTVAQQEVLATDRPPFAVRVDDGTVKLVDLGRGRLAFNTTDESLWLKMLLFSQHHLRYAPLLQVVFTVQI